MRVFESTKADLSICDFSGTFSKGGLMEYVYDLDLDVSTKRQQEIVWPLMCHYSIVLGQS